LLAVVLGVAGCPDEAKEDLREAAHAVAKAGEKLEDAAEKTGEVVEQRLEGAAERAKDVKEAAGDMVDPKAAAREAAEAIDCEGNRCTIASSAWDKIVANPVVIAQQVTVSPQEKTGVTRWRIDEVREGSACERLGLREGDIVLRVNGERLGDSPRASLLDDLQRADEVVLDLDRGGKRVRLEIHRG
jgi:type II secretory pathway component PulC